MKKIILALFVVALCCSCVTKTGMCFDMRISEASYKTPSEFVIEESEEEPVIDDVPPMVGVMIVIRTDEEGVHLESNSSDAITTSASTGAYAPFLPPTTLEEETYNGRTRFLSRANGKGAELDIYMTNRDNAPSAEFKEPIELSLDISGWNEPESFRPMWTDDDGRGSTLIVDPNYYVELGDDWDNSDWSDEPSRPTEPGTYRVYGW